MLVDRIITGMLEENCYILSIGKDALIVDPGDDAEEIIKYVMAKFKEIHTINELNKFLTDFKNEFNNEKFLSDTVIKK